MIWILILILLFTGSLSCQIDEYFYEDSCIPCSSGLYCYNNTARLCQKGYYCPKFNKEIPCNKYNFCLEGSIAETPCVIGWLTCPDSKMTEPYPFIGGLLYSLSLFIFINLLFSSFKFYKDRKIKKYSNINNIKERFKLFIPYIKRWVTNYRKDKEIVLDIVSNDNIQIIDFHKLLLKISRRVILDKIYGFFVSGKINVILGESGSGKSSLLNILIGKNIYQSKIEGEIKINNSEIKSISSVYKKSLVYIEQFYKFYENLTVEENIYYYHVLFTNKIDTELDKSIEHYLNLFEIENVRDLKVGNETRGGISGGQRKKLSLAMELIRNPDVIVLDEPTSGLDSAFSIKIFRILEKLANSGKTIIVSIHQPRRELLVYFDYVSIMMYGGNLIYCGKKSEIVKYFESIGYLYCNNNIMDFVIDIVTGIIKRRDTRNQNIKNIRSFLKHSWNLNYHRFKPNMANLKTINIFNDFGMCDGLYKIIYIFKRNIFVIFRNRSTLLINFFFTMFLGFFIGTVYGDNSINGLVHQVHSSILIVSLISIFNGVNVFGNNRHIIYQELFNGLNLFAIFIARVISNFIFDFITISIYTVSWMNNTQLKSSLGTVLLNNLLIYWVISGVANLLSLFVNRKNMTQVSYLVAVILWVLNGVNPSYNKLYNNVKSKFVTDILLFMTPLNEGIKMMLVDELKLYSDTFSTSVDYIIDLYKIDINYNYKLYLLIFGLILKILSFIVIYIIYKIKFKK
jgi:ABC-type multidrug transport system ATPase subunit